MLGRLTLLFALAAALISVAPATAGDGRGASGAAAEPPTDQIVIRLASGRSFDATGLDATAGVNLKQVRRLADGSYVLKLPDRRALGLVRAITERLAARGEVVLAEPDAMMQPFLTPADPSWSLQWDLFAPAAGSYGANLPGAWDITLGSAGITVGVIDTGYRPHGDLGGEARFVAGYDFIGDALIANDGNGRDADAHDPGDWVTSTENASGYFQGCGAGDSSWHGTHVSGTIGAVGNNGQGVAGINWVSKIQPLRVLGKCGGYTSDIADAIRWGAGLTVADVPNNLTPSKVLNISLGGGGACSTTYQSAINAAVAAGTVVVVAAGNSNTNASGFQPANCSNVITVAATAKTGNRAYYSNYGSTVEIAAPGGDYYADSMILSTLNDGLKGPGNDSYDTYQGTSMATPHVVGVVSLMLSANPNLTPAEVTTILRASATPFPAGSTCTATTCGTGILNAAAAVAQAKAGSTPVPTPTLPGAFSKVSPATGATSVPRPVTISWNPSNDATSYEWCYSTTINVCSGWTSASANLSASLTNLKSRRTYYWQVRAKSQTGGLMDANGGSWWSFRTR